MSTAPLDPARFDRLSALFARACDLDAAERQAFVDQQCAGDPELRERLLMLLRADAGESNRLESSLLGSGLGQVVQRAAQMDEDELPLPIQLGRYRLLRVLASGGMGTVYEAEQDTPRRAVAIKLLRPAIVSPQMLRRFRHEAEILGTLQHPGIAQVHDSGSAELLTPGGTIRAPYIVMELVRGQDLLAHARDARLDLHERLRLFIKICHAVQHAHLKGVIHRDLKPANILVDTAGQPKIVDFGIARHEPAGRAMTEATMPGQLLGTLAYMSPEQVLGDARSIDTRSDIYSLGVVLYELLTHRLPLDVRASSIAEAARILRDEDAPSLAAAEPTLVGDLSTIVAKALAKRPQDRYQSAEELGGDLRRYLDHEPILARRASATYVMRKFARRHRALVASAGVGVAALLVGAVVATIFAIHADRARAAAEASDLAARREAARSAQAARFMRDMLSGVRPAVAAGRDRTMLREILNQTAARIDAGELADEPEVEAEIRATVGSVYRDLGVLDRAATVLEGALDALARAPEPAPMLRSIVHSHLGGVRQEQGRFQDAEAHFAQARDALTHAGAGPGVDEQSQRILSDLAALRRRQDKPGEARRLYEQLLAWAIEHKGPRTEEAARHLHNLAGVLADLAQFAESEARYRESLEIFRSLHGDEHPSVAIASENLGNAISWQRKFDEAEPFLLEALRIHMASQGENALRVAGCQANLANLRFNQRRFADAEALYGQALASYERALEPNHLYIAMTRMARARCAAEQGRFAEGEAELVRGFQALVNHPEVPDAQKRTARAHLLEYFELWHAAQPGEETAARLAHWRQQLRPAGPPS